MPSMVLNPGSRLNTCQDKLRRVAAFLKILGKINRECP